ncbi:MAG: RNA polymerase sigma-70 factor [Pseudomonadota bacterium]|nr:MAG: RNA polymerase subunit sigma-70 [Pseudomonadota bacterium]
MGEVADTPGADALFGQERARLWSVAYRMLGSRADAEDVLQDAWLRWQASDVRGIHNAQAWLVTTVTRLCIDRLRRLRTERELYTGPWLPEPLVATEPPPADAAAELASDLSVALLAVLERLAPEERAAFLLREAFDVDYADIARILGKSEAACRQLVSRAARRVRAGRPRVRVDAATTRRLLDGLVEALRTQDQQAVLALLAPGSTWTSDGGGKVRAARKQVRGAGRVARFATGVYRKLVGEARFRPVTVNGEPGYAVFHRGALLSVITIHSDGRRILDVFSIMNPDKLRHIALHGS